VWDVLGVLGDMRDIRRRGAEIACGQIPPGELVDALPEHPKRRRPVEPGVVHDDDLAAAPGDPAERAFQGHGPGQRAGVVERLGRRRVRTHSSTADIRPQRGVVEHRDRAQPRGPIVPQQTAQRIPSSHHREQVGVFVGIRRVAWLGGDTHSSVPSKNSASSSAL
jgi:hypothetical protein